MSNPLSQTRSRFFKAGIFGVVFAVVGAATLLLSTASQQRDVFEVPFTANSVWNTPIGSNARYVDSGLPYTRANAIDYAHFIEMKNSYPTVDYIRTGGWRNRCDGTQRTGVTFNLPNNFEIEPPRQNDNGSWSTPNNGFEFLRPDGRTVFGGGGGARCQAGGPIYGAGGIEFDAYGDGLRGSHGASKLPRLGGAIRAGELSNDEPIQHVLDLVLYTKWAYSDNKQTRESTYRWPASGADAYALDRNKTDRYIGTNPEMRMGALLAIPPSVTERDLNITTKEGRKLFAALRDWGGYFTDDSAWNANYLTVDAEARGTFQWGTKQKEEFGRMVDALHVVANNGPNSIGGGGTPRVAKHPVFRNGSDQTPAPVPDPTPTPPAEDPDPVQEAYILPADNLVVPSIVTASSQVSDIFTPDKAVDGDEQTNESRWTSARQDNQWIQFDLESSRRLDKLSILWAGDTTRSFQVQLSQDGTNFTTVASSETDGQKFFFSEVQLNNSLARYIRINGVSRWNENFGHSIREVGVYVGENVTEDAPTPPPTNDDPTPSSSDAVTVPYRVNSGGSAFTDSEGNQWVADENFLSGGGTFTTQSAIDGTESDLLYQTERWCTPGYSVPIVNGTYTIVFHAAEINPRSDGRVMNVAVEGQTFVDGLNLTQQFGDFVAYERSIVVEIRDGFVDLEIIGVNNCQKISGFEILPANQPDEQSPTVNIVNISEDQVVSDTLEISVQASDNTAVTLLQLYVDGALADEVANDSAAFTVDTTNYVNGEVEISVIATDAASNEAIDSVSVQVNNPTVDNTPPTAPQGLQANATSYNTVALSWQASTDGVGVAEYTIYRNGKKYAQTTALNYTDTNATEATEYVYSVTATDAADNESVSDGDVTVTTPVKPDTIFPTEPTSFSAVLNDDGTVSMTWDASDDNVGVEGYFVYRSDKIIASLEETTFVDRTAVVGQAYDYSVRAYDAARNLSPRSTVTTITIAASQEDTTPPSNPTNLKHVRYLRWKSQFDFAWNTSTDDQGGAITYKIYRNGKVIAETTARSFSDATIKKRVSYNYEITAVDQAGNESGKSNKLFFKARR